MNPKYLLYITVLVIAFTACKSTQTIQNEQILLIKNDIECSNPIIDKSQLWGFLKQKPNRKLFGLFRFNKWIYSKTNNGTQSRFKSWLNKTAGEEPVYYDELFATKSSQQMKMWLQSKGFYTANVQFSTQIRNQKAKVVYRINTDLPYLLQTIEYTTADTALAPIIRDQQNNSVLKKDNLFDISDLEHEQTRLVRELQNRGYFQFTKEYIRFTVDTALGQRKVALTVNIAQPFDSATNQNILHPKFKVQYTNIHINHQLLQNDTTNQSNFDSIAASPNTSLFANNTLNLRPQSVLNLCYINNQNFYQIDEAEKTQRRFLAMPLIKSATIQFQPNNSIDSLGYRGLNCYIDLSQNKIHAWSFDVEETNTAGDWGTELKTTYTNRNLFRGFERLQVRLRTLLENNKTYGDEFKKVWLFNTLEYGIDANILIPVWLSPFKNDNFNKTYTPQTIISSGFSYHQIPYYTRPTIYFSYGYTWKGNRFLTHTFNPIELRGVRYLNKSQAFTNFLNQRYYYLHSYEDYFISSTNYSLVYNHQDASTVKDFIYVKMNFESAGNILYAFSSLAKRTKYDGSYHVLETQFAQYLKADIDFRYYMEWSQKTTTVYRLFTGLIAPYGNQDVAPNIKKYTAGGASSMRGWTAQTLGPGSYSDTLAIKYSSGDIRLEANLEHRFPLFWMLNGAIFTDIGNIWSVNTLDRRTGAKFSLSNFYNDLAVDAGFGLRLDVSFFVLRTDLGVKLRDPANTTNRWIIGNRALKSNDLNLSFGIGYPF